MIQTSLHLRPRTVSMCLVTEVVHLRPNTIISNGRVLWVRSSRVSCQWQKVRPVTIARSLLTKKSL